MTFTALHRALGVAPGPLTDELLDAAVNGGVTEANDLDWKSELPPAKGLPQTDFPKDVAAMANSGGGVIVFGVRESQKAATERVDVGEFDEAHERSLRSAAITAISPPVFGLNVHRLGDEGKRAVVVEIPSSIDGPHLIYRNDYFGAPVRNDSDTVWMKERQIEAMYRARFDERRHATEALDTLFAEAAGGRSTRERAWLIAVAHPRIPRFRERLTRDQARDTLTKAKSLGDFYAGKGGIHPLDNVDQHNPRPGLRRWVAVNTATGDRSTWKEAWASIHHDGSVTLAAAVGGHRMSSDAYFEGWQIESAAIECSIADLMALVRVSAEATDNDEYDIRVGIEWTGEQPLTILTTDNQGFTYDGVSTPLHRYTPVETTVNAVEPALDYYWHVHDLAQDCVNQGGVSNVRMIQPPERTDPQ
ncbi:MAG: putative DNA binding domain-containing protein [Microbacterium sp.]|uniref:AlbA family DNA-binding domain-containing protein n=1 Tax=Microbacterium sp. TaxID=51671 RepID=UPI001ACC6C2F|nr:RNA-binding domain-containing protein [Microbacterium sp.]MBN9177826.1 putative DNA binding domain-containing protein [Microbacterium sp.]